MGKFRILKFGILAIYLIIISETGGYSLKLFLAKMKFFNHLKKIWNLIQFFKNMELNQYIKFELKNGVFLAKITL